MAHYRPTAQRRVAARIGGVIVAATAALTLAFFGLVALATGGVPGFADRFPFYVLAAAAAFVAAIVGLDGGRLGGRQTLAAAGAAGIGALAGLSLCGEGVVYAANNPEQALVSRRVLYLVAAGLAATGLGYWVVRHWNAVVPRAR